MNRNGFIYYNNATISLLDTLNQVIETAWKIFSNPIVTTVIGGVAGAAIDRFLLKDRKRKERKNKNIMIIYKV